LLAEDNVINQKLQVALLTKLGCSVQVAADGREALEAISQTQFDLIFMDCHMPTMDGYEATKEIRLREAGATHIPVIALTASAMPQDRKLCFDAGMDDYLSKPLRAESLRSILVEWLPNQT
jgi:CheY-like chemotaxis protein